MLPEQNSLKYQTITVEFLPMSFNFKCLTTLLTRISYWNNSFFYTFIGAKFDAKGNMRDWWSAETLSAFEKNSQCMIDQYSNYSILNTSVSIF